VIKSCGLREFIFLSISGSNGDRANDKGFINVNAVENAFSRYLCPLILVITNEIWVIQDFKCCDWHKYNPLLLVVQRTANTKLRTCHLILHFECRFLAVPRNLLPGSLRVPIADNEAGNRALMPSFDLAQDCLQVVPHGLHTFAGVPDFDGLDGHRVGEISFPS